MYRFFWCIIGREEEWEGRRAQDEQWEGSRGSRRVWSPKVSLFLCILNLFMVLIIIHTAQPPKDNKWGLRRALAFATYTTPPPKDDEWGLRCVSGPCCHITPSDNEQGPETSRILSPGKFFLSSFNSLLITTLYRLSTTTTMTMTYDPSKLTLGPKRR